MPRRPAKPSLAPFIQIRGARQNNLKGFDLDIPLNQLTVVTGPSGSGKSSLAFATVYAEGQRRYVETFSPYTRQFFERMDKPLVDEINGIPPAIAIEQSNHVKTTRSTVGTITEINDYLKLYFPKVASASCPSCGARVQPDSASAILQSLRERFVGQSLLITFGVPVPAKTRPAEFFGFLQGQGYLRVLVFGQTYRVDEPDTYERKTLPKVVDVIQDRLKIEPKGDGRLMEALEAALRFGKGKIKAVPREGGPLAFSMGWHCAACDLALRWPSSALFNFNHPLGACKTCRGFGRTIGIDLEKAIPDPSRPLHNAILAFQGERGAEAWHDLERHARRRKIDTDQHFEDLSPADQEWVLHGEQGRGGSAEKAWKNDEWYGVMGFFQWLESKAYKMHVRVFLSRFRSYTTCADCGGGRLQPEALYFRHRERTLPDLWRLPIDEMLSFFREETPDERDPSALLLYGQILSRLRYLEHVGLGYLTLDRSTRTLSGGELQRVNLTTCLGAALVNTLFVMDEPSIGLHPRDLGRLVNVMHGLRDKGNTLLVVEHEEAVIRAADYLVDLGPGRGEKGGELTYAGPAKRTGKSDSLTFGYLDGKCSIPMPEQRRTPRQGQSIGIMGARQHNLRKLNVEIPLGVFCCVTGVSGSGKSTLVHSVLHENLARLKKQSSDQEAGRVREITGAQWISEVVLVDQSPIGRTPRSTPAVYLGVYDTIRLLFAGTDQAVSEGLTAGFFSFNSGQGRCGRCMGAGFEKVEMQFLSDLFVTCPECEGTRFTAHALSYKFEGQSVHDVLSMTISEARGFFAKSKARQVPKILDGLDLAIDVGLGYLSLGQGVNTLSGGEAQRLKLCERLVTRASSNALLIFDEPTTGLHFDDIAMLLRTLHRLVDMGNSIIVIEHNLEVIKNADHIIDLGPEAGAGGGQLVAQGTPEEIALVEESHTGRFLAKALGWENRLAEDPVNAPPATVAARQDVIHIQGARENNLKNLTLDVPRDQLVVVTGLSGSGKSTLAFDILFAEGQRRFLDSMSTYARQFTEQMEKAEVDLVTGLPPTVAIEQRISRGGGKSTVATVTEVYHFLRLLFAKLGTQHCPKCSIPVAKQSVTSIITAVTGAARAGTALLLAPLIKARKGFHTEVAAWAEAHGYDTLLVDGKLMPVKGFKRLTRFQEHSIDLVVARLDKKAVGQMAELQVSVEEALRIGKGTAKIMAGEATRILSTELSCPQCERAFEELDPRLFSYNSPHGWCLVCRGYGLTNRLSHSPYGSESGVSVLQDELLEEMRRARAEEAEHHICQVCGGSRLNEVARAVKLRDLSIGQLTGRSVGDVLDSLGNFRFAGREAVIARDIMKEITQRLRFLNEVGLGYLGLDRSATTLSGGESQRIRLAAQLGSNLRGVLYVLDEPSIGLHPRDNGKLLDTLHALRDQGNSVVVVEHDDETMRRADHILDLGPGAGKLGGEVVAQGSLSLVSRHKTSLTGQFLRQPLTHPSRGQRRPLPSRKTKGAWLEIKGACANNLKKVDLAIPLGRLVGIAGVSGSGKSSLMRGVIEPAVSLGLKKRSAKKSDGLWGSVKGAENFMAVYEVDQSPIGKTSRSTPSTYVGVFDEIRKLFASVPSARVRGYTASRFSFNTAGGRCENCEGHGQIRMEMDFLPTSHVRCEACAGWRYNPATLEIEFNGQNIGQVMRMTVEEAEEFFRAFPKIHRSLKLLRDTGMGYLQLGQPSPTLSGGEAQRIKLVTELTKGVARSENAKLRQNRLDGPKNLYLIEEPSIGLHMADVSKLVEVLHRLVDDGHTVLVIEHNLDILAEVDFLLELGPEAGAAGGQIVAADTPENVAMAQTVTAPFLRELLRARPQPTG